MSMEAEQVTVQFDPECPSCGASIEYNPEKGLLKCPFCGFEQEIEQPEEDDVQLAQEMDFESANERGNFDWGVEKKTIICQECAAETIYDALQVADTCPYCGSHQVMEASTQETLAPNGVCKFDVTDKVAGENFHHWIRGRFFAPRAAKVSAKPDSFLGVYLPHWTFDAQTYTRYTARYGITRMIRDRDGEMRTETDWYATSGSYNNFFDDELVSATNRYDRSMMQKIEPFDLMNNKPYRPEYVTGFLAERYSVGLDDGFEYAKNSMRAKIQYGIEMKIRRQYNADIVTGISFSTNFEEITYKYLMLPIWLSSFRYKDRVYHFMVNGQTGKVGGSAPISPIRVTIAIIVAILAIYVIYMISQR